MITKMEYHIPKTSILYKGMQKGTSLSCDYENPCWFAFDFNVAEEYAKQYDDGEVYTPMK